VRARTGWPFAPSPRFVIVGTGRCGTGYTAKVLTEGGIPCGHEEIYRGRRITKTWRLIGDASYLAVPHLADFPGIVLHQVREPVAVVRSLVGTRFFDRTDHYLEIVARYLELTGDPVVDAMRYWIDWNHRCEHHADLTYRVEDLPDRLPEIVTLIDPGKTGSVMAAAARVSTSTNTRQRAEEIGSIDDLPGGKQKDRLVEMGRRYGYDLQSS
jgi:hypothetical protein